MKLHQYLLSALAAVSMGMTLSSHALENTENLKSAEEVEAVLDHLGLFVEDPFFAEEAPFKAMKKGGGGDRGGRGGGDRAGRGGGNRGGDRAGRGGGGHRGGDRAGRGGRHDGGDRADRGGRHNGGRHDGNRAGRGGGHRDHGHHDRSRNRNHDDDGSAWRRRPTYPVYPVYPVYPRYPSNPQLKCYARGADNRLYPTIGYNAAVTQDAAMRYCQRYTYRCVPRGCVYN